jgi:hypothetical protein
MVYKSKRLNLLSFSEREWSGRKEHSPLKDDLKVIAYKQAKEYIPGEEQRTVLLVEPHSFDNGVLREQFFARTSSRLDAEIDFGDKTLNLILLAHGYAERDTQIVRSLNHVLTDMKALEKWSSQTMKLERIVLEFYGCNVHKDYQYAPFLDEIKKLARFGIPLVVAFGGVNELLTTGQFKHSQMGYSDGIGMSGRLAKYSFITFNGAEIVSMKCDFGYINQFQRKQKQTYMMLCPHTGRGVWTNGSKNWWDTTNTQLGIYAPRICFYQHFIRSSSGIPSECSTMSAWDFPARYVPKFLKNNM